VWAKQRFLVSPLFTNNRGNQCLNPHVNRQRKKPAANSRDCKSSAASPANIPEPRGWITFPK